MRAEAVLPTPPSWPVVVTRPEREAVAWVQALAAQGFEPVALPLMDFAPPTDMAALASARQGLATFDAAMFVSPQAAHAFWSAKLEENSALELEFIHLFAMQNDVCAGAGAAGSMGQSSALRCWAPGPGTARALLQLGVPAHCIDQPPANATQFDSDALWPVVQAQMRRGARVLVVRGDSGPKPKLTRKNTNTGTNTGTGTGRDWLALQCQAAGAEVQFCVAYRRGAPVWSAQQQVLAQSALDRQAVWLLSSSESVGYLKQLLPTQNWQPARAVATHPRIAASAKALGFGQVVQARPDVPGVLQALAVLESGQFSG